MIENAIRRITKGQNLSAEEAMAVMDEMMSGKASDIQKSAYLTALAMKGETIEEITGSAAGMRAHCLPMGEHIDALEIVGTGGDGANTFNISTTSAFVIAASGIPVAKHGNRAASSRCGAADCLEALGAVLNVPPSQSVKILQDVGFCFLFAQQYHSAMRYVGPVRKELGIRTIFNILGPLTNPANAKTQIMGVFSKEYVEPLAKVLYQLGVTNGMTVYGMDGMDEISACGETLVCEINGGNFKTYSIVPEDFDLPRGKKSDLLGGSPAENAAITRAILSGKETGTKYNAVLLNAAAGIYAGKKAPSMREGVKLAKELISSGKASEKLEAFIAATHEETPAP